MTRHQEDYTAIRDQMRQLARSRFESAEQLQQLRSRLTADRMGIEQRVLDAIAKEAHIDLRAIFERARGPRDEQRRDVAETLARLQAQALRRAHDERDRFHRTRTRFRAEFEGQLAGAQGTSQLKFRDVIFSDSDVSGGTCTYVGGGIFSPWVGPDTIVTADIATSNAPPGTWLHPKIDIHTNDCDDTRAGMTFQDLTYRMEAPATSFGVEHVRVDLIGNGLATSHVGDTPWLATLNPLYEHTHITLDVYLGQEVHGEWELWPLVSDTLFTGRGEYVSQVRSVLSGQTYPINLFVRGADTGGGPMLCLVQVMCATEPIGNHGYAALDFSAADGLGMFVGGVALIGASA